MNLNRLPKWVRELLADKDREIAELEAELSRTKNAHSLLFEHESWFTVHGPPNSSVNKDESYKLFFLSQEGAHPACSLKVGDVLVIGRKPQKKSKENGPTNGKSKK
jgi:hypothetical protein